MSETLRDVLHHAGYGITVCSDTPLALALLQLATAPVVVVLSHGGPPHWRPGRKLECQPVFGATFGAESSPISPGLSCSSMPALTAGLTVDRAV